MPNCLFIGVFLTLANSAIAADVRLNVTVSSTGQLNDDSKGTYYTGRDGLGAWLDPTRYPTMSFDICTNWPFRGTTASPPPIGDCCRTVVHRITDPVPGGGAKPIGVFNSPYGNDVAISKPLVPGIDSFTEMRMGSTVSPDTAEVRFANSDSTEYYSLVFGDRSLFYRDLKIDGKGTTKPTVTRNSETSWTISFPAKTIGRLWKRSGGLTDLGLFYYEGSIQIQMQVVR